jgi:hypothetical protein
LNWDIFFQFRRLKKNTENLRLELQRIEQEMHNMDFANQLSNNNKEKDFAYLRGRAEGVKWCLEKSSGF